MKSKTSKRKMKLKKKTSKQVGGGNGGKKRESNNAQFYRFLRRRLEADLAREETKEETMHQEEKSNADPKPEELNSVSDFLLYRVRPEIRKDILNYAGIEKYFKLNESKFISNLIREIKKRKIKVERLMNEWNIVDKQFNPDYPEGTIYELEILKSRMDSLDKEIRDLTKLTNFYRESLNRSIGDVLSKNTNL